MIRLRNLVVASTLLVTAPALVGAQGPSHPNLARGFDGDALHDFSGIDSVNLFNLSGQLTIPLIGRTIDGGLSYDLTLVWSSNDLWDLVQVATPQPGDPPPPDSQPCSTALPPDSVNGEEETPEGSGTVTCADPSKGSNAGLGFRVHPGRLYRPGSPANSTNAWIYEDSAGSSHRLVAKVHADDGATDVGQCFSRDNSRLRLRIPGASNCTTNPTGVLSADVEFGNGVIHRFTRTIGTGEFQLSKILDRFGNEVTFTRLTGPYRWVINDGYRTHTVKFETRSTGQRVIDSIDTAAFNGTTATYDFSYVEATIDRNCKDEYHAPGAQVTVTLLSSLTLPDGTSYSTGGAGGFETACTAAAIPDLPGVLKKLTLPTGGALQWTWQNVNYLASEAHGSLNRSAGVATKAVLRADGRCYGVANPPANDTSACRWTYSWQSTGANNTERKVTVRDPAGDETVHWFDQKPTRTGSGASASGWEYGLPMRKSSPDPTGGSRYLSREVYDGTAASGTKHQTVYVAYGHDTLFTAVQGQPEDWYDSNRRMTSERVLWNSVDGSAEHWATTTWSGDDGLGNFRTQALSGSADFGTSKTTFTNYNEGQSYPDDFTPPGIAPETWTLR